MQKIRIGTRESKLAIWQAEYIQRELENLGKDTEIIFIKSDGEINLVSPLYEMGIQGIFTKTLDIALLNGRIDIAVHSLKDVPTELPNGVVLACIPKRGNYGDTLIYKGVFSEDCLEYMIGTSSLRRRAQWLNRYPTHKTEPLRGNIQARLEKLKKNTQWNGAIFATAAIERLELKIKAINNSEAGDLNEMPLDWMLPAPAQGALGVTCRENDAEIRSICQKLTDKDTEAATKIERQFLRSLNGGCSMPIGAYAYFEGDSCYFEGNILSIDGKQKCEVHLKASRDEVNNLGENAALEILKNGGEKIRNSIIKK